MIRFFRKIRQRLLTENRFSKYFIYAIGEIILVVIGILIALQINTWNDRRIQNDRVKAYAKKLCKDLTQDIQNTKFISYQAETAYLRLDSLSNYARLLSIEDCNNLDIFLLVHNARYKPFSWNRASFEEVKSSGILNYFDNDSLVNLMVKYEAYTRHMDLDYEEDRELIQEATKLMSKVIVWASSATGLVVLDAGIPVRCHNGNGSGGLTVAASRGLLSTSSDGRSR